MNSRIVTESRDYVIAQVDAGHQAPEWIDIMEALTEKYPDEETREFLKAIYVGMQAATKEFINRADNVQRILDSDVGQMMRKNPGMTFGEAMRKLGHWPNF